MYANWWHERGKQDIYLHFLTWIIYNIVFYENQPFHIVSQAFLVAKKRKSLLTKAEKEFI